MSPTAGTIPPPISWAQRNDLLYVIIDVECKDIETNFTENSFTFKGTNALNSNIKYEVTLNFLNPINPQEIQSNNIGRCIEYTIYKKESGPFWKSLTNDKTKLHFLKTNFLKWKSEDEPKEKGSTVTEALKEFNFNYDDDYDSDDNIPSLSQIDDDEDDKSDEEKKDEKTKV